MEEKAKKEEQQELLDPNDFEEEESDNTGDDKSSNKEDSTEESTSSDGKSTEELEKEEKAKKNAHFAELRRKREAQERADKEEAERKQREQQIRDEATLKAKLDLVKENPYTQEPIKDEEDLRIYEIQKQLDEEGKDPNTDLAKRLAELSRKEKAESKAKADAEVKSKEVRQQKIDAEIKELRAKYPDLNTSELADDKLFQKCLEGRAGRWTQVEIYELYLQEKSKQDSEKEETGKKALVDENGKKITKTPSSTASGRSTPKTVEQMSDEEFADYWSKKYGC